MTSPTDKSKNVHEGHRQRLRERFLSDKEMNSFREHEILEYILSLVIPRKDTNVIAHELIAKYGSLNGVLNADPKELKEVKNMTTSASYLLASLISTVRRSLRSDQEMRDLPVLDQPYKGAEYLHPYFLGRKTECLAILFLNCRQQPIGIHWLEGMHTERMKIDVEDIVKRALKEGANYVLMGHNHPTSRMEPSDDDIIESIKLYQFLRVAGMRLNDSVIFSDDGYLSLRINGYFDKCEREWMRGAKDRKELREGAFFTSMYKSNLREYILDAAAMRAKGDLVAVERNDKNK